MDGCATLFSWNPTMQANLADAEGRWNVSDAELPAGCVLETGQTHIYPAPIFVTLTVAIFFLLVIKISKLKTNPGDSWLKRIKQIG